MPPRRSIALAGLLIIAFLLSRKVPGAIVIGIISATAAGLLLGVSQWPAGAWLRMPRFDTVFQADRAERARHSIRAAAAFDRHGGFLRHPRHGHRDCGNRRLARSRGTHSTAPLDSRHRLPERHHWRRLWRELGDVVHRVRRRRGRGRPDRPAQRRRRGPLCRVHVRGAADRRRPRGGHCPRIDHRRVPDVPADRPDRLYRAWTPRSRRS